VQNLDLGIGDCAFKCRLMCPRCLHKSNERTPIWGRVAHPRTIPAIHRSIEGFDQLIKYFDHNRRLKRLKNYFRCLISRFSRFGGRLFTVFLRPGHKSHRVPLPGAKWQKYLWMFSDVGRELYVWSVIHVSVPRAPQYLYPSVCWPCLAWLSTITQRAQKYFRDHNKRRK